MSLKMHPFRLCAPKHSFFSSRETGRLWALPGLDWQVAVFPTRLCFSGSIEIELYFEDIAPWIENFEVNLDVKSGVIRWYLRGRTKDLSPFFLKLSLYASRSKQLILTLDRLKGLPSLNICLQGRRLQLQPATMLDLVKGEAAADIPRAPPHAMIDLWLGTNYALEWSSLIKRCEPWGLVHQLIAAMSWLEVDHERLYDRLALLESQVIVDAWPNSLWQLLKSCLLAPLLFDEKVAQMKVFPSGLHGVSSNEGLWLLAQLFLRRWYIAKVSTSSLFLNSGSTSRAPSGRLVHHEPSLMVDWYWRAGRTRHLYLRAPQGGNFHITFAMAPKTLQLTQTGVDNVVEKRVYGKELELELLPGVDYFLDRLQY